MFKETNIPTGGGSKFIKTEAISASKDQTVKDSEGRTRQDIINEIFKETKFSKKEIFDSIAFNETEKQFYVEGVSADKWISMYKDLYEDGPDGNFHGLK